MIFQNSVQLAKWLAAQYPTIFTELLRRSGSYTGSNSGLGRLRRGMGGTRYGVGQLCICGLTCLVGCDSWACDLASDSNWGTECAGDLAFSSCVDSLFDGATGCAGASAASISSCVSDLLCGSSTPAICTTVADNIACDIANSSTAQCLNLCSGAGTAGSVGSVSSSAIGSVASLLSSASGLASLAALASNYFASCAGASKITSPAKSVTGSSTPVKSTVAAASGPATSAASCQGVATGACSGAETGGVFGSSSGLLLLAATGIGLYYFLKR